MLHNKLILCSFHQIFMDICNFVTSIGLKSTKIILQLLLILFFILLIVKSFETLPKHSA